MSVRAARIFTVIHKNDHDKNIEGIVFSNGRLALSNNSCYTCIKEFMDWIKSVYPEYSVEVPSDEISEVPVEEILRHGP